MSDRVTKAGLSTGSSWSLFAENIAFEESDHVFEKLGKKAETTRLHAEDISKFGICPARAYLQLVVCKLCQKSLKCSSLQRHYELKHPKYLSSVKPSPPKRCIPNVKCNPPHKLSSKSKLLKAVPNKAFIRIEEMNLNEENVKIEEVPLTIPNFNSLPSNKSRLPKITIKKINENKTGENKLSSPLPSPKLSIQVKGNMKKIPNPKEKEYDADKHCGVWIPELERNCTRSLTCKTHPLSLRRYVPGRCKDFDVLLAEHRARAAQKGHDTALNLNSSPSPKSRDITPVQSPYGLDKVVFPSLPLLPSHTSVKKDNSNSYSKLKASSQNVEEHYQKPVILNCISDNVKHSNSLPAMQHHPKPITVNSFGARQSECRCKLFTRKMDHFRNATTSLMERYKSVSTTRSKQSLKDPAKISSEGINCVLQDPLQNGIIHKQKSSNMKNSKILSTGMKRHISLNELNQQGIIADSINNVTSPLSKRRNSADKSQIADDAFLISSQHHLLSRTLSSSSDFEKLNKPNEFLKPNSEHANLLVRRSKSANSFLNSPYDGGTAQYEAHHSPNDSIFKTTTSTPTEILDSSLNLRQSLDSTNNESTNQLSQNVSQETFNKLVQPAPNITITQGMLVSLPGAVFQQSNPQNVYTMGSQAKETISINSVPNTTSHARPNQLGTKASYSLKQNSVDPNLHTHVNGRATPRTPKTPTTPHGKELSSNNSSTKSTDNQLAPNVTVTTSHSLSGVLHGVAVSNIATTNQTKAKNINHPVNSTFNEHRNVPHPMVVQHQNHVGRDTVQQVIANQPGFSPTAQAVQQQAHPQLSANFTTLQINPGTHSYVNNTSSSNTIATNAANKQYRKMQAAQIQQHLQQQQMQSQHFITMHAGYQQQILPKVPTVPQVIPQYQNQQFTPSQSQRNVQFISQNQSTSTIQQQHGGALS